MSEPAEDINLYDYNDYRTYLRDWFEAKKKTRASMSYRRFAERAGFKSSNYIMLVIQGKRNLTADTLPKTVKALKLAAQDADFFSNLVAYNQAKTHEEEDRYYNLLLRSKKYQQRQPIRAHQHEYCSAWYHAVIRELITAKDYDGTPEWLMTRLGKRIKLEQVEASLELLEKLELIHRSPSGRWEQSSSVLAPGTAIESVELFNYHKTMMKLLPHLLGAVPAPRRYMGALTLGVTKPRLHQIKKKIEKFRQDILKLVADDTETEEVLQLNIYLFPMVEEPTDEAGGS